MSEAENLLRRLATLTDTLNNCEIELAAYIDQVDPFHTKKEWKVLYRIQLESRIEMVELTVDSLWALFTKEATH